MLAQASKIEERKIIGDCLEGIGIPNGGIAVIDRAAKPNVFDVVWCDTAVGGAINGCLKQIIQTGAKPIVHTVYKDHERDYAFYSPQIYGVVLKVMDYDRNVVWERPEPVEYAPVKRGRWEVVKPQGWDSTCGYNNTERIICSECRKEAPHYYTSEREHGGSVTTGTWIKTSYCPACGARMGGE